MKKIPSSKQRYVVVGLLCIIGVILLIKGCQRDYYDNAPASPMGSRQPEGYLKIAGSHDLQAKAAMLRIEAESVDDNGNLTGTILPPVEISSPIFPQYVDLEFWTPPCQYQIMVTVVLTRDPQWIAEPIIVNVCHSEEMTIDLETFEPIMVRPGVNPINAPDSALGNETIAVSCGPVEIDAPDSDRFPVTAILSEDSGGSASGPIGSEQAVSDSFLDPFPQDSPANQRLFTCTISDGRSPDLSFEKIVERIPPCTVINNNDSGAGSLRQVLADASTNGCSTISFATGVQGRTITLISGQLTVPAITLTIDGGSGVTVSGNNNSRVFYVPTGGSVVFENLVITQGRVSGATAPDGAGGGIYNNGGTITIGNGSIVSFNRADGCCGGGIFSNGGTVFVDGAVTNNAVYLALFEGGGGINVRGPSAMVVVRGTVSNNSANHYGGGVYAYQGTIIIERSGIVRGNTADGFAGGIYTNSGAITIRGRVIDNTTNRDGGGILLLPGTLTIGSGNLIENNTADADNNGSGAGGGIYNGGGTISAYPNYGTGNWRGTVTPILDNCSGPGGCP